MLLYVIVILSASLIDCSSSAHVAPGCVRWAAV